MATAAEGRNDPAPIIVKKVTVIEAGHHGGAWKVAYADFVTAMMAFFLLLWLLGATTEDQRKGLADYFTPTLVKTKEQSAGADGVLGGSSLVDVDNYPHAAGQTGTQTLTVPRDATGGPREGAASIKRIQERVAEAIAEKERLKRLMHQVRMIPTTTGAARAVGLVLPELAGKLDGSSVRVPTPNVSLVDLVFTPGRDTSAEELNAALKAAAEGAMKGVLDYTADPLVSSDFNHHPASSTVDSLETSVMEGKLARVVSWYDNEWGFSNRMIDTAGVMAKFL